MKLANYKLWIVLLAAFSLQACGHKSGDNATENTPPPFSQEEDLGGDNELFQSNTRLWVDIRDLAKYESNTIVASLLEVFKNQTSNLFPQNVRFLPEGEALPQGNKSYFSKMTNTVFGVEISSIKKSQEGLLVTTNSLFSQSQEKSQETLKFRRHLFLLKQDGQILSLPYLEDLPSAETNLEIHVGLADRKVILIDSANNIRKVYPTDVGGFDEGVSKVGEYKLMTPQYSLYGQVTLNKLFANWSRTDPHYYQGYPFMPFALNGGRRPIAFHVVVNNKLKRSFDSHGCVRLRAKDVLEVATLLKHSVKPFNVVQFRHFINRNEEHPHPLDNQRYETVTNYGSVTKPIKRRTVVKNNKGEATATYLTDMRTSKRAPPVDKLQDIPNDVLNASLPLD